MRVVCCGSNTLNPQPNNPDVVEAFCRVDSPAGGKPKPKVARRSMRLGEKEGESERDTMSSASEERKGVESLKNFERALGHVRNR